MKNSMQRNKDKIKRPAIKILLIVLGAIALCVLCFAAYTYIRLHGMKDDRVEIVDMPTPLAEKTPAPTPTLIPVEGVPEDIDVDHDDEIDPDKVEAEPIYALGEIDENVINILVMGEDIRPDEEGRGRSDTMMVLSYDREANTAKLVSFLRDTYVYIQERDTWNRINTAYRFGGVGLAINTINSSFGLDIQYYVITDFENLKQIVDMLGGLELHISAKEAAYVNKNTPVSALPEEEGTYLLTGAQVLTHCRNRRTGDGDWGRTTRQRQVMLAFFNRAKQERNVETLAALANNLLKYVRTNMEPAMLIELGVDAVFSDNFTLSSRAVPFEGTWKYASVNGASVIQIDADANKELLYEFLYGGDE